MGYPTGQKKVFATGLAVLAMLQLSCGRQSTPPKEDILPPRVISLSPGNTDTNVPINKSISVTFSEPVDEKTIAFRLVVLKGGGSVLVPLTMSYSGTTAVFKPDHDLEYMTSHNAWVGPGVKDLAGNEMTNDTTWSFTTSEDPDTSPPRVVDIQPPRGKTGVSPNSAISIMFSEPMDPATITSSIKLSNLNGYIGGAVSYNGATATATFTPSYNLSTNKEYTVTVTTDVIDLAKNAMTSPFVSIFKTGTVIDSLPPSITSVFPLDTASGVDVNVPIAVTFSEPMDASTILPIHFIVSEGTTTVVIPGNLRQVGKTAIFTPTNSLKDSTSYTVTIPTIIKDLAGNGLSTDYTWSFTTGAQAQDTVQPSVLVTFPSDGQTNVPIYQQIVVLLNEKMLQSSITPTALVLRDQYVNNIPGQATASGAMVFFTPAQPLLYSRGYTAILSSGITDLAGNPLAGSGITWSFTTEPVASFTITSTAGFGGSISPDGSQMISQGSSTSYTITPAAGYHLGDVQVDGSSVGTPTTYTFSNVTSDHTINASFAIKTYTVTAAANANGFLDGTTPSPTTVNHGSTASFKFSASAAYHVASVTNTCGGAAYNNTSNSVTTYTYTTPAITAGCSVTASFAINTYTVTPSVVGGNGSISPNTAQTVNSSGTTSFTLTPTTPGYHLVTPVGGTCGGTLSGNVYTTNSVTGNCSVQASFAIDTHTLTVTKNGTGTGTVTANSGTLTWTGNIGTATYNYGTSVTLTASSDVSSTFTGWSGEGCTGTGTCIVSMTALRNVTTNFTIRTFTITPSAGSNGTISPANPQTVNYGATPIFTFTPAANYYVSAVTVDSSPVASGSSYTFAPVMADHSIAVSFLIGTWKITATAGVGGTIASDGVTVPSGTSQDFLVDSGSGRQFAITPNSGNRFIAVRADGVSITITYPITYHTFTNVTSNRTIDASFTANQATLTVVATPQTVIYGNTSALSATGGSGTGAVTYSAGASSGCLVAGSTLSVTNASGTCAVTATKAEDTYFNATTSAPLPVTLQKANQTALIAVATPSAVAYGSTSALSATGGSGTGAVTYSAGASTGCSVEVSTLSVTNASGTCAVSATRAADNNYNAATSPALPVTMQKANQTTLTVMATPSTVAYGSTSALSSTGGNGTGSVTYDFGLSTGCSVAGSTLSVTNASGTCAVSATRTADNNFNAVTSSPLPVTLIKADQATLTVVATPSAVAYGSTSTLSTAGGSGTGAVTYSAGASTGCLVAVSTLSVTNAGGTCAVTATRAADTNYNAVTSLPATVTLIKVNSSVTAWPTAGAITYGQTLASSTLSGGVATPAGSFAFTTPTTVPNAGTASQGVTFTPTDTVNYNPATGPVSVTVTKADQATLTVVAVPSTIAYGSTSALSATGGSGTGAETYDVGASTGCLVAGNILSVTNAGGTCAVTATRAADTNYNAATSLPATITLIKANPSVTAWPTASAITYGQTLASSTLSGGVATPAGTFTFTTPTTAPNAGTAPQEVLFTPTDTTNYNPATGSVSVTVNKANATITWPTASAIIYGQTLADSTLTGGVAIPAGTFTFTTPTTAPNAGTAPQEVTFTPTDTVNYNPATGPVSVTVNKANPSVTAWPTASAITYGQTLASSTLSGGVATPAGAFAFTAPTAAPNAGTAPQEVIFTPTDTTNYNTTTGTVSVTVNKANPSVTAWPTASSIIYGQTLADSTLTGGVSTPAGAFAFTTPTTVPDIGTSSHEVTFTPTDTTNYNTAVGTVSVTVDPALLIGATQGIGFGSLGAMSFLLNHKLFGNLFRRRRKQKVSHCSPGKES